MEVYTAEDTAFALLGKIVPPKRAVCLPSGSCVNPRRHVLYKQFDPNVNRFLFLRSNGVSVLTSYFLSESGNMIKVHRQLSMHQHRCRRSLSILKTIQADECV